jgi:hypothetical protein
MNLGFFAADTLNMTLYQIQNRLKASEIHQLRLGPWKIEMDIDVESDIITNTELAFWVTIAKTLRLYLIVREKESWLFVLNAAALKKCGAKTGFAGQSSKERVNEFKPAIKGLFRWRDGRWEKIQHEGWQEKP